MDRHRLLAKQHSPTKPKITPVLTDPRWYGTLRFVAKDREAAGKNPTDPQQAFSNSGESGSEEEEDVGVSEMA